jgi:deoxyhypusine synthase
MEKRDLLSEPIEHAEIASLDAMPVIDALVAAGAAIVDMDFFEAIGFRHYRGSTSVADNKPRELYIDRIYDASIDEPQLQTCDNAIATIADGLDHRPRRKRSSIFGSAHPRLRGGDVIAAQAGMTGV